MLDCQLKKTVPQSIVKRQCSHLEMLLMSVVEKGDEPASLVTVRQGAIHQAGLLLTFCRIASVDEGMGIPNVKYPI